MAGYERNLVLVHTPNFQARSDFETISAKLAERAPDIETFIVSNLARHSVTRRDAAGRPTMIFSPVALRQFKPVRGSIFAGRSHSKMEEIRRLGEGGLRVPESVMIEPQTQLDPATWGELTVVKPNRGMQGAGVMLRRTRDVRWADPNSWPKDDPRHGVPLVAQKFIDTGAHPTSYRVLAIFGRPLYSAVSRSMQPRSRSLDLAGEPDGPVASNLEEPIASNVGVRGFELNFEADVIAYGASAASAFPEVPVLGVDVIREEATGHLWILEVNAGGLTWHISSNYGMVLQRKYGIDLAAQFGALDVAADALIEVTRREAV
ncbi:MAG: hypothetical protein WDM84_08460 [Bauldia sp.]